MADYVRQHDFSVKDALTTGDPNKVIKGSEVDEELDAILTAVGTKVDKTTGHTTNNLASLNSVGNIEDSGLLKTDVAELSGSTFTGAVVLAADPTAALGAATKQYVDNIVSISRASTGAVATGTTVIPSDDTIPTSTEGTEFMTLAHTPQKTTHRLRIQAVLHLSHSVIGDHTATLFQDAGGSAIAVATQQSRVADQNIQVVIDHEMEAGTASETTFKVRAGHPSAGTMTLNGVSGSRLFGGVLISSMTITEYVA